jgi:hypothetical protein
MGKLLDTPNTQPWDVIYGIEKLDYMAVQVSPHYGDDHCVCAVGANNNDGVYFQIIKTLNNSLEQAVHFILPGTTSDYGPNSSAICCADIVLPPDFNAIYAANRVAFVSVGTRTLKPTDGVYKIEGVPPYSTYLPILSGSSGLGIRSIDFYSDNNGDLLVAGEYAANKVWHSHDPFSSANWTLSTALPDGENEVVVGISPGCHRVFAGTSGNESGISRSPALDPLTFGQKFGCSPDGKSVEKEALALSPRLF